MVEEFLDERSSASSLDSRASEIMQRKPTTRLIAKKGSMYPNPIKGELKKYSPALFRSWQTRTVTLEARTLKYYKGKELMGVLNFDLYSVKLSTAREKDLVFELHIADCERVFQWKAPTQIDYNLWCTAIAAHLEDSQGSN